MADSPPTHTLLLSSRSSWRSSTRWAVAPFTSQRKWTGGRRLDKTSSRSSVFILFDWPWDETWKRCWTSKRWIFECCGGSDDGWKSSTLRYGCRWGDRWRRRFSNHLGLRSCADGLWGNLRWAVSRANNAMLPETIAGAFTKLGRG